ncbi:MAG: zinc ribbon domain-containing protein [Gemmataceae bacterium]|nr:zinc ribbon domain-containing protein [Gemmataceae bacterium]
MPTYEYQCDACGHRFDELQSFSEPTLKKCPACKKKKLQRLIGTGAAILFKGDGFYQTDYRSESYKAAAKADATPQTTEKSNTDAPKTTGDTKATTTPAKADAPKTATKNAK